MKRCITWRLEYSYLEVFICVALVDERLSFAWLYVYQENNMYKVLRVWRLSDLLCKSSEM